MAYLSSSVITGEGDRALARWKGRLHWRFSWCLPIFSMARAPSTMHRFARMVPLPRYRGADKRSHSRDAGAPEACPSVRKKAAKPSVRRQGNESFAFFAMTDGKDE
jgi:hypothetical protein